MKTSYSSQTVSFPSLELSFDQMGVLEDALTSAAIDAVTGSDAAKTSEICSLCEELSIDIDIDDLDADEPVDPNDSNGPDSDAIDTSVE
jgi:hypothetical protein